MWDFHEAGFCEVVNIGLIYWYSFIDFNWHWCLCVHNHQLPVALECIRHVTKVSYVTTKKYFISQKSFVFMFVFALSFCYCSCLRSCSRYSLCYCSCCVIVCVIVRVRVILRVIVRVRVIVSVIVRIPFPCYCCIRVHVDVDVHIDPLRSTSLWQRLFNL